MAINAIKVTKANVHNLQQVSVEIPKNSLCVITGPSGSGKSSLAFDTIYVEGQRRYIESLSSYARQFLGQFQAPDVESISGLSPAIAIDQKSTITNPRSTVGTITEVFDYMRVLFARVGDAYCPETGGKIEAQSPQQIVEKLQQLPQQTRLTLLAPLIKNRKGSHWDLVRRYQAMGFSRIRLDGKIVTLDDDLTIAQNRYHDIELIIDRILTKPDNRSRLTDSVELALKIGQGYLLAMANKQELFFSEKNYCAESEQSYPELTPRLFSFNSPLGACSNCNGIGYLRQFSEASLVLSPKSSLLEKTGPACPALLENVFLFNMVKCLAQAEKVDLNQPLKMLTKKFNRMLFYGSKKEYEYSFDSTHSRFSFSKKFPGMVAWLEKKYRESSSERVRQNLERYMETGICPACNGQRLKLFPLAVLIAKKNIMQVADMPIDQCLQFFRRLSFQGNKKKIAQKLVKEITERLTFLHDVGLSYLTLNRTANSLSGGEAQRIRLATQIGSALSGVLYVLDEPSIGLHQRDNIKLIKTLKNLRDLGNTVLVVEHDEETIRESDHIIDIGPGAGSNGGRVVAKGNLAAILRHKKSITARYLQGKLSIDIPSKRRPPRGHLALKKARHNNLKSIDVEIPLGNLVCITGVSGSGKSTLIHDVLLPAIRVERNLWGNSTAVSGRYHSLKGVADIQSLIELDQSPIGRSPKSNPATYAGAFNLIRDLFARLPEAKARGYRQGRFSFNVKDGRCGTCEGNGVIKIEMHFLPDVFITCAQCRGRRYNDETLNIVYKGRSIADILAMTVAQAATFFANHSRLHRILQTLVDVGLGYITLGQSATTLSGGEAQRLKLARELAKSTKGNCLYVLDEPTTGLHFSDIKVLLSAIEQLIAKGHTVVVIEHNLEVIKTADHIIDLGPEGGDKGGEVVFTGTPEQLAKCRRSYTGKFLKRLL